MSELLKKLGNYYRKEGISALDFNCPYSTSCRKGYNDFTEAKGTFIGSGYEQSIARLLFISLDPGGEDFYRQPKNRTLLSVQRYEMKRDITALRKNLHWYRTVELALNILKKFNGYHDLQINQATQYFAHINSVKCCVNNPSNKKAASRLFKNCRGFVPREVEILKPNIIVTQGKEARLTMIDHYETHNSYNYSSTLSLPKELRIFSINNHPILWINTYHPRNGLFNKINYKNYNQYAEIAFKFVNEYYKHKRISDGIKTELKEIKSMSSDCFSKYAAIVEKVIGQLTKKRVDAKAYPWFCQDISRKNSIQWAGHIGPFSKQTDVLVFGINLEHTEAWKQVFPNIKEHADTFSELVSKLENMKWHWWKRPGKRMPNPPQEPLAQHEHWTSEVNIDDWLKELEDIIKRKKMWDIDIPIRPQLQIMRLIGTCDQISDEELIEQNIRQAKADLQPIVDLFKY